MKKYIVYLILCFVSCLIFSCTSVYENGDTSCIPEGMERLTFKVIVPSSKVVGSNTRSTALEKENEIKDLFVKIGNYDSDHYRNFYSTQNGTIHFDSYAYKDSKYRASIEVPVGTFRDGDNIYVWANQEYPIDVTSEEELTTPLYMSGIGTIRDGWGGGRFFEVDVHLLRGVAKLRTVVRTTKRSVLGSWNININRVETQILHMPSCIRPFAPFETHRNPAANDWWNDVYHRYIDCTLNYLGWWISWENSHLLSSVELPIDDGVNVDKVTETSYDRYIYENWLENESDYDENMNVTALKVRIPLWNNETGENRTIKRVIPIKTNDSYRILRNHIYTVDVRVLSVDDVEIDMDLLDWREEININGDVPGEGFTVSKGEVALLPNITDPTSVFTVSTSGRPDKTISISIVKADKQTEITQDKEGVVLWDYTNGSLQRTNNDNHISISSSAVSADELGIKLAITTKDKSGFEGGFFKVSCGNSVRYLPIVEPAPTVALDINESYANCYIAEKVGTYSFNGAIMGNGAEGIIHDPSHENPDYSFEKADGTQMVKAEGAGIAPKSAKLLWQDAEGLITQVAFNNDRVEFITSGSQGFGNAVIAVYDNVDPNANDAKVLWSWHIWCAPRPSDRYIHSESGGTIYTFMDRNIGAVSDAVGDNSYGLYYQWGRKDPFEKPGKPLFDVLGMKVSALHELKRVSLSEGILNPMSFFSKGTDIRTAWSFFSPYRWEGRDITAGKSIYDPCPYGYRVPINIVFYNLRKDYYLTENCRMEDTGVYFSVIQPGRELFFPMTGVIDFDYSFVYDNGLQYWTASPMTTTSMTFGWYNGKWIDFYDNDMGTARGLPIRCVRED